LASLHLAPIAPREVDAAGRLPRGSKRGGDDILQAPAAHLAFCFVPPDGASLVFAIGPGLREELRALGYVR
jgi:hypothetical protein